MAEALRRLLWVSVVMSGACSVGVGTGEATGQVEAPACGMSGDYQLSPNFFVADAFENQLQLRIQRGGDWDFYSDGIAIYIADTEAMLAQLGTPLTPMARDDDLVTMTFYANASCPLNREDVPVSYQAVEGQVTFFSIYAPEFSDERLISGEFVDMLFVDPSAPEERFARLDGHFEFLFNRGRPAQRFP